MVEILQSKVPAEYFARLIDLLNRNRKIKVETHQRLNLRVNGLTADRTIADTVPGQYRDQFVKKIHIVSRNSFPKCDGLHIVPFPRLAARGNSKLRPRMRFYSRFEGYSNPQPPGRNAF